MPTDSYGGDGSFTVPPEVDTVTIDLYGEDGQGSDSGPGGIGGYVKGELDVTSISTIYVRNSPSGQTATQRDGGDGIWLSVGGTALADRVAAVGGGGGSGDFNVTDAKGGDGGGDAGEDGKLNGESDSVAGDGGTQSSGGSGGNITNGDYGGDGDAFSGGGDEDTPDDIFGGGAGGGGHYGGGQGSSGGDGDYPGGGGSSYDDGLTAVFANEQGSTNSRAHGDGALVEITYVPVPSGVSVDTTRYRSVDLSWDSVSSADEYRIYRDGSQIGTTTSTSFTDSGLDPTTSYDWYITAIESGAESDPSATVSGTTGGNAPGDVSLTVAFGETTLTWTDTNDDEEGYEIHRATDANVDTSGPPLATVAANAESYTDTAVDDGVEYHYRVVAVRNDERGNDSVEVAGTVPLPAPTDLTVTGVGDTTVDLAWTSNTTDATGHRIDVREDDTGEWTDTGDTIGGDAESATATGLLNGQLYGLRVVALAPDAESVDYAPDVFAGETLTIESGETFTFAKPHINSGTVANAGIMQPEDTQ